LLTLAAFAANSLLCRQALNSGSIGPVEFTTIRLGSGIIALLPVIFLSHRKIGAGEWHDLSFAFSNIKSSLALFSYALFFSLAYIQLDAGIGALILFASVQITMIGISLTQGNKITALEWMGIFISFMGLIYLLLPGLTAPPPLGTFMMILSGISWGVYSLLGRNQARPIFATARNFLFCLPGVLILAAYVLADIIRNGNHRIETEGIILAVISGAFTSGMGYVLWYLTVRRISTTLASVSQLAVPIFTAVGGVLLLGEILTLRLIFASIMIIGGIAISTVYKKIYSLLPGQSRL